MVMKGMVTNIQGFSIHDGPGIRTVVFLKGCPLECQWCSNPENIAPQPEIGFVKNLCVKCGKCAAACPEKAIIFDQGQFPVTDRNRCKGCGVCSDVCTREARVLYGKLMDVDEVFDIVNRDKMFFQASGGGVTVSGGEPFLQPEFVSALLDKCRQAGIHTCIETSGYAATSALRKVLQFTDLVLFDLKHMNSEKHCRYTGKPNDLIHENAGIVVDSNAGVFFRMPFIPEINDDDENIREIAEFLHQLGDKACNIQLMPYHELGKGKYKSLDKIYKLSEIKKPAQSQNEMARKMFESYGINCSISY